MKTDLFLLIPVALFKPILVDYWVEKVNLCIFICLNFKCTPFCNNRCRMLVFLNTTQTPDVGQFAYFLVKLATVPNTFICFSSKQSGSVQLRCFHWQMWRKGTHITNLCRPTCWYPSGTVSSIPTLEGGAKSSAVWLSVPWFVNSHKTKLLALPCPKSLEFKVIYSL